MTNILEIRNLTSKVADFTILDDLDFDLEENELRVLLGPNGAGKTTLIDMVTGRYKANSGKIYFDGRDISRLSPDHRCNLGIGRKFQVPNMYETLSVFDNVMVSLHGRRKVLASLLHPRVTPQDIERIEEILEFIGLEDKADEPVDTLSHGERQWLEIGMLVAANPKLVLLDEPTTGMTEEGKHKTAELIQKVSKNHTVLLVEHDIHIVRQIARKVTVLHLGRILAEGPLSEVVENEEVRAVYLGTGKF